MQSDEEPRGVNRTNEELPDWSDASSGNGDRRGPLVTLSSEVSAGQAPATYVESPDPNDGDLTEAEVSAAGEPVRWRATEYIHRHKSPGWFVSFIGVTGLLMAAAIFLMKSWSFALLIPVMAAALIVYSRRPPRELDYVLSRHGLHINDELYPFVDFRGFALIHGDDQHAILLIPTKRFLPGVTVYFPGDAGEAIVDMLAARLPMQEMEIDFVDQIIRKLRL